MSYHDCDAVEDTVDCLAAKLERYEAVVDAARAWAKDLDYMYQDEDDRRLIDAVHALEGTA